MAKGIKRAAFRALLRANADIKAHADRGGPYAGALASEGYNGGYRDALMDVLLALDGNTPSRNGFWNEEM